MSEALRVLDELSRQGINAKGVCADSREIAPGDVFLAMPGATSDGRAYIGDALARGAAAVVWEREGVSAPLAVAVPAVAVSHLNAVSGEIAAIVYGRPSEAMWLVGVTGTNGKTSVSQWVATALQLTGKKCAVVGTLGYGFLPELRASANTTPDAVGIQRALAGFKAAGAAACAMEVSSIGLTEGRVAGCAFDVAVFTNLTRDHLDYHDTMETYGAAKQQLFAWPGLKAAVINVDDDFGRRLCKTVIARGVRCLGYTLQGTSAAAAYSDEIIAAEDLEISSEGMSFSLHTRSGSVRIATPLLGRFNAANLLAVSGALLASGLELAAIGQLLPRLAPPAGRMQTVTAGEGCPLVVVDYAHTPDALEQALVTLREFAVVRGSRLVCVFGCGGERDPGKRPLMGSVAQRLADDVVVTSDNPRGENPQRIIDGILGGMGEGATVEPDRAAAIAMAVAAASARDVVLIAGKGHEPYQEIAGRRIPFSDLDQARAALHGRQTGRQPQA